MSRVEDEDRPHVEIVLCFWHLYPNSLDVMEICWHFRREAVHNRCHVMRVLMRVHEICHFTAAYATTCRTNDHRLKIKTILGISIKSFVRL